MNLELMKTLCEVQYNTLYSFLTKFLHKNGYIKIYRESNYIMAEGEIPICLIAHMDTVFKHKISVDDFINDTEKKILWCPHGAGFDDRAGIYCIIDLIKKGYKPHVIFTNLEEVGGVGASDLIKKFSQCPYDCKFLIQLDRANKNDCVFYNCDNQDFTQYIETFGFVEDWGTFSDISIIAPAWKIAAVNLSVGYMEEHSANERLNYGWTDATIEKVEKILCNAGDAKYYEYIEYISAATRVYGNIVPRFVIKDDECLICGSKLNPHTAKYIYDDTFPYSVCPQCFMQYYLDDETPNDQILFN